ncbi:hypothetical protein AM593_09785, partial [Mytilus galloprovincialis]
MKPLIRKDLFKRENVLNNYIIIVRDLAIIKTATATRSSWNRSDTMIQKVHDSSLCVQWVLIMTHFTIRCPTLEYIWRFGKIKYTLIFVFVFYTFAVEGSNTTQGDG